MQGAKTVLGFRELTLWGQDVCLCWMELRYFRSRGSGATVGPVGQGHTGRVEEEEESVERVAYASRGD